MAVDQAGHHQPHGCVESLLPRELSPHIRRLADGGDAVLAYGYRSVGDYLAILVEREQNAVLYQNISMLHHSLGSMVVIPGRREVRRAGNP